MLTSYPPQPPRKGQGYQPPPQRLSPDSPFMFGMFDAGPADLARPASLPQLPRLSEAELQEEALATLLRLFDASWCV